MEIKEKSFVVMTKDGKMVLKGLSKSERHLMKPEDTRQKLYSPAFSSTFSTAASAKAWTGSYSRIQQYGTDYSPEDLEVKEITVTYAL